MKKPKIKGYGRSYGYSDDKPIINKLREEEKLRANIIREMKKKHPKGFCYICGKGKATIHHLKNGKEIPLCRPCHDEVEEAKVYINSMKSRKSAYKKGMVQQAQEDKKMFLELIDENIKFHNLERMKHYNNNKNNKSNIQVKKELRHQYAMVQFENLKQKLKEKIGE